MPNAGEPGDNANGMLAEWPVIIMEARSKWVGPYQRDAELPTRLVPA